jgi:hypothetical protein
MMELLPLFFALVGGAILLAASVVACFAKRLVLRLARGTGLGVRWRTLGVAALAEIPIMIIAVTVAYFAVPSNPETMRFRPWLYFVSLWASATCLSAFFALVPHAWLVRKVEVPAGQSPNDDLWWAFLLGLPAPLLVGIISLGLCLGVAWSSGPLPIMYAKLP